MTAVVDLVQADITDVNLAQHILFPVDTWRTLPWSQLLPKGNVLSRRSLQISNWYVEVIFHEPYLR